MPEPISAWLPPIASDRSYLADRHWFPAHQHSIRCMACILTHPLPNLNLHPLNSGLLSADGCPDTADLPECDTGCRCTWVTQGPLAPLWHSPPPGHLVSPEQVPVTRHTRPPLWPSNRLHSSCLHLLASSLPVLNIRLRRTQLMRHWWANTLYMFLTLETWLPSTYTPQICVTCLFSLSKRQSGTRLVLVGDHNGVARYMAMW